MGGRRLTCCSPCCRSRPTLRSRRPTLHCHPCCLTCALPRHLRTSRIRWLCFCSPPTPSHNCTQRHDAQRGREGSVRPVQKLAGPAGPRLTYSPRTHSPLGVLTVPWLTAPEPPTAPHTRSQCTRRFIPRCKKHAATRCPAMGVRLTTCLPCWTGHHRPWCNFARARGHAFTQAHADTGVDVKHAWKRHCVRDRPADDSARTP